VVRFVTSTCLLAVAVAALTACSAGGDAGDGAEPGSGNAATDPACPTSSRCYDFTDDSQGWPEVSDDQHFAGHDVYLEGSYRVGVREPGSWSMPAPLRIRDLSPGYGVKIEVDATPGRSFPDEAAWGATCWTRDLGGGRVTGFGVDVAPDVLTVGLYDEQTGAFHPLKTERHDGLTKAGKKSHLTLRCGQVASSGTAVAKISAQLDGSAAVAVSYDSSPGHDPWTPADGLGLVAAGQGADVFYDHVVVTPQ
jgi:hypothetical protein